MSARILCFAGSARRDSLNKKLAKLMAKYIEAEAAEANFVDLKDYPLPIYDGDMEAEEGIPENAIKFRELLSEHDGIVIASPEYNSSFSPLLKNTIDWVSRKGGLAQSFRGKTALIVATATGSIGGLRGLVPLRMMLGNIGVHVMPQQVAVPHGDKAFDADGNISGDYAERLETAAKALVETTSKLIS